MFTISRNIKLLYIYRLFFSGLSRQTPITVRSRILFFRILVVTCVPMLMPLIVNSFIAKSYLHAAFNSFFVLTTLVSFFILAQPFRLKYAVFIGLTGTYSLLSYIIITGGSFTYDILFIFIIPYLTYFLVNCRIGGIVNFIFLLMVTASLFIPGMPICEKIGNIDITARLFTIYAINNFIAFTVARIYCKTIENLEHIAFYDYLTGLPNRQKLDEVLETRLQKSVKDDNRIYAMMLNLDNLKSINDSYSHQFGDKILIHFVERIKQIIPPDVDFGRHASADFLIFGPVERDSDDLDNLSDAIHESLQKPFEIDEYVVKVTTCIGITHYPDDAISTSQVLKNLDLSLSQAKKFGPGTTAYYNEESHRLFLENFRMAEFLREAHKRDEIHLVYQPRIDIKKNRVTCFEVLARWKTLELGSVPPNRFIPIAEDTGLITRLTEWIIEEAWNSYKTISAAGYNDLKMSINFSPMHLKNANFYESLMRLVDRCQIDPTVIEMEITEGLLLNDSSDMIIVLNNLAEMGFTISLDDFGTGYSSLSYIKKFNVNCIKVDRSFIMHLKSDPSMAEIVRAIIAMARSLNLTVVAEGVEYDEQVDFLKELECDQIQGFYFSKPLELKKLLDFLKNWS
jgi:diguanylate cyclase (GGDEF)-like protein